MFKKIILMFALTLSMLSAHAVDDKRLAGYDQLTDAQKAELSVQVQQLAQQSKSSIPAPSTVERWAGFGQQIGSALAGTARELGVVANDFIKTPAGQVTLYLIIWKVIGNDVAHIGGGLLILAICIPMWFYMMRRLCVVKGFETKFMQDGEGKQKAVKVPVLYNDERGGEFFGMMVALAAIIGVSLITIFTM